MSNWSYLYIDEPGEAFRRSGLFMDQVAFLASMRDTPDAAVFARIDTQTGGMHYHFTPDALATGEQAGASICAKPSRKDIGGLLVGEATVIDRLFQSAD